MVKIFISYRRADSAPIARQMYDALVDEFSDKNVFKDIDTIPGGHDFRTVITDWMTQTDVLLVLIGDKWLTLANDEGQRRIDAPDDYVRFEIELGLRLSKVTVIPIILGDTRPPSPAELPESLHDLAYLNAIFVRTGPEFEDDMTRLVEKLGGKKRSFKPLLIGGAVIGVLAILMMLITALPDALSSVLTTTEPQILFTRGETGSREIYRLDITSDREVRLTNYTGDDHLPRWSPDGNQIAYISHRSGEPNIFVMDADGGNLEQLTDGQGDISEMVWSPSNDEIAYIRQTETCSGIHIVNLQAGNSRELSCNGESNLDWSPSGEQLVFGRGKEIDIVLYTMNVDGTDLRPLGGDDSIYGVEPMWSPDSTTLVYAEPGASHGYIFSIGKDAPEATFLSPSRNEVDSSPVWSPDGNHIAFLSLDRNNFPAMNMFVMSANGSNRRQLTTHSASDYQPSWSPDSRQLAFTTERNGNQDIYLVSIDATDLRSLVDSEANERDPQWRPDPNAQ